MSDNNEVRELREQVRRLTERVFRLEQQLAMQHRPSDTAIKPAAEREQPEAAKDVAVRDSPLDAGRESAHAGGSPEPAVSLSPHEPALSSAHDAALPSRDQAAAQAESEATRQSYEAESRQRETFAAGKVSGTSGRETRKILSGAMRTEGRETLETRIGSQWSNRIGIVAVLVAVSYFLKYAFENGWIGPATQVVVGLVAGVAMAVWSERFRRRGFAGFSYSLKAVGAGALYLSLWASFALYSLVPAPAAFAAMVLVTGAMAAFAVTQGAEVLAALALIGGFLTPVLVSTGRNQEAALFSYLLLLDAAALLLQRFKSWPRILFGSFIGTELLFVFWYVKFYSADQFAMTSAFLSAFFALFAAAPLVANLFPAGTRSRTPLRTGVFLPVLNALVYFCAVYAMLDAELPGQDARAAGYLMVIASLYGGLGMALERRASDSPVYMSGDGPLLRRRDVEAESLAYAPVRMDAHRLLPLVHLGTAVACLTAAIAMWLNGHWIAFSWLVEAAALFYAGTKAERPAVRCFGTVVAALAVFNLLVSSVAWRTETLLFNERFGLYLLAIAVIAAMIWWQQQVASATRASADKGERSLGGNLSQDIRTAGVTHVGRHGDWLRPPQTMVLAVIAMNVLALFALNFEIGDYFGRELQSLRAAYRTLSPAILAQQVRSLSIVRDFTYSAMWMAYGAALMWAGFWKRSEFLRWQAIVLIGITVVKVFTYDVSALQRGYRILAFLILGVILLGISFAYQKNWLGLQKSRSDPAEAHFSAHDKD